MWPHLTWLVLLGMAIGLSVSAPAATTLATCVPLTAISAAPAAITEATAPERCAADVGLAPAFAPTPEITRC